MRKRSKLQRKLVSTGGPRAVSLSEEISINLRLRESIDAELCENERRAVCVIKTNPKHFFGYAKKRLKTRSVIGPLRKDGGLITDPAAIAEALQSQYTSSYTRPYFDDVVGKVAGWQGPQPEVTLETVEISKHAIQNAILQLEEKSAVGPDGVPAILLK